MNAGNIEITATAAISPQFVPVTVTNSARPVVMVRALDAVIVGSPVYFGNMSGEVKTFFDNWTLKFGLFQDRKMRNKVGAAFATGASVSNGKDVTMLTIVAAMLIHQMVVVSGGGGFGASATTGPESPGIDEKEVAEARELGRRVAEFTALVKRGSTN